MVLVLLALALGVAGILIGARSDVVGRVLLLLAIGPLVVGKAPFIGAGAGGGDGGG